MNAALASPPPVRDQYAVTYSAAHGLVEEEKPLVEALMKADDDLFEHQTKYYTDVDYYTKVYDDLFQKLKDQVADRRQKDRRMFIDTLVTQENHLKTAHSNYAAEVAACNDRWEEKRLQYEELFQRKAEQSATIQTEAEEKMNAAVEEQRIAAVATKEAADLKMQVTREVADMRSAADAEIAEKRRQAAKDADDMMADARVKAGQIIDRASTDANSIRADASKFLDAMKKAQEGSDEETAVVEAKNKKDKEKEKKEKKERKVK